METPAIPFRLSDERLHRQLGAFNARDEIQWFGFQGTFEAPGTACIRFKRLSNGALGGGGTAAINGGVISAGFDAAFVLAGLAQYDVAAVVTLDLSVQFLSLAKVSDGLVFKAEVVRSSKHFCFAKGGLYDRLLPDAPPFAVSSAMLTPAS